MIAGKALRKYLATTSGKDEIKVRKKRVSESPNDSKLKPTSISKARTDRIPSPNYKNSSKIMQKSSDYLKIKNIKSSSKSTERLLNVLKDFQHSNHKSNLSSKEAVYTSPKTKKVSEVKRKEISINSSGLRDDSLKKFTSIETKRKKADSSTLGGNAIKTDSKSSKAEKTVDNCSRVKQNIVKLLEKSKANEITRTRRGITSSNFNASSSLRNIDIDARKQMSKYSDIFTKNMNESMSSKYSFKSPSKDTKKRLKTDASDSSIKQSNSLLVEKKAKNTIKKSEQRMREIIQAKISEQSHSSSRKLNSSKRELSYGKSQTKRSYKEPSSERQGSTLAYAEENLKSFLQRGHREIQSRTFDFAKNLSNFVDLLRSLSGVHKENKQLFSTLSSIVELNMEKILEEFSDLNDLLIEQKEEVDKVRELDSENLYLMAKINKAVKEAKEATEDYNRVVEHLDAQGVPQFDALCKENEKLKESLKAKLQIIQDNCGKEQKLMKVIYEIRKKGVDVDSVFKETFNNTFSN